MQIPFLLLVSVTILSEQALGQRFDSSRGSALARRQLYDELSVRDLEVENFNLYGRGLDFDTRDLYGRESDDFDLLARHLDLDDAFDLYGRDLDLDDLSLRKRDSDSDAFDIYARAHGDNDHGFSFTVQEATPQEKPKTPPQLNFQAPMGNEQYFMKKKSP